jgi:hypothetical protein
MCWTPLSTDGGEVLVSESETSLAILSLNVGRREGDHELAPLVWLLREWIVGCQEPDFSFESSSPTNSYQLSSREIVGLLGEQAAWAKDVVGSSLRSLRRLQEGSSTHAVDEELAREAAAAEYNLLQDASRAWPDCAALGLRHREEENVERSLPANFDQFVAMAPLLPARVPVSPRDSVVVPTRRPFPALLLHLRDLSLGASVAVLLGCVAMGGTVVAVVDTIDTPRPTTSSASSADLTARLMATKQASQSARKPSARHPGTASSRPGRHSKKRTAAASTGAATVEVATEEARTAVGTSEQTPAQPVTYEGGVASPAEESTTTPFASPPTAAPSQTTSAPATSAPTGAESAVSGSSISNANSGGAESPAPGVTNSVGAGG